MELTFVVKLELLPDRSIKLLTNSTDPGDRQAVNLAGIFIDPDDAYAAAGEELAYRLEVLARQGTLSYDEYDALLQQGCTYIEGPPVEADCMCAPDASGHPDPACPWSPVPGGQWAVGTYRLTDGRTLTIDPDGTARLEAL